jgi:Type II secretion system (T2SS), protein M subtype b
VNSLPDGIRGKAAALGIAALAAAVIYLALVSPLWAFYQASAQALDLKREMLRRSENAVNDLPRLRALSKRLGDSSRGADLLLSGSSDSIAAAQLQSTLKDLVETEGAKLTSTTVLRPEIADRFRRVGVRVSFSGDLKLLTAVLQGIEKSHPVMAVGGLELHVAGAPVDASEDPNLAIALDIVGFRANEAVAP